MLGSGPWMASGLLVAQDMAGPPGTCSRAAGGRGARSHRGGGWHAPSSACLPANPEIKLHDSLTTPIKHLIDGVALYYLTPRANKQCRESSLGHTVIKVPSSFQTEPAWARLTRGPSTPQRPTRRALCTPQRPTRGPSAHRSGRRGGSAHPSGQTRAAPAGCAWAQGSAAVQAPAGAILGSGEAMLGVPSMAQQVQAAGRAAASTVGPTWPCLTPSASTVTSPRLQAPCSWARVPEKARALPGASGSSLGLGSCLQSRCLTRATGHHCDSQGSCRAKGSRAVSGSPVEVTPGEPREWEEKRAGLGPGAGGAGRGTRPDGGRRPGPTFPDTARQQTVARSGAGVEARIRDPRPQRGSQHTGCPDRAPLGPNGPGAPPPIQRHGTQRS